MKLSNKQKEVITKMRNGWQLIWDDYRYRIYLTDGKKKQTIELCEFTELDEDKIIEWEREIKHDVDLYHLTELGKSIKL